MAAGLYCPRCGHPNRETAAFCRDCGERLAGFGGQVPASPATAGQAVGPDDPAPEQTALAPFPPPDDQASDVGPDDIAGWPGQGGGRRRRRPLAVGAAVVTILGAVVVGGWLANWPPQIFGPSQSHPSARGPATHAPVSSPAANPSPTQPTPVTSATSPASSPATAGTGPASVVQEYFAAINAHDYRQAWDIVHRSIDLTYQKFKSELAGTALDTVTITAVSGDMVTANLQALQTNGTIKYYSGTYTVKGGVIVHADVRQVTS